ncbi:MAG: glycosyltransferase, partial [Nitrospinae bacterium]|nr:glycosyltransferase [Nitrospinota bacterium]
TVTLNKLSNGKINVFFIGRISPNKGHKGIIYTAYYYKLLFGNNIRFIISGGLDPKLDKYYNKLKGLIYQLGIGDIIEFTGRVSFSELKSYYSGSHIFLLLSEHEGFCIPILESQYFKLPIIAYGTSAVKETIGENQLVYDVLDYETISSAIYTLSGNSEMKSYLVREGYENFLKYEKDNLKDKFLSYLKELE